MRRDTNGDGYINLSDSENLFMIPADGGVERLLNLRGRTVFSPSWSPDGRYILVLVLGDDGQNAIWRFDLLTEDFVRITEPGPYFHPRYSNAP
jgi:Tol biopolymer transport system component